MSVTAPAVVPATGPALVVTAVPLVPAAVVSAATPT
jgi:hypothetical protein